MRAENRNRAKALQRPHPLSRATQESQGDGPIAAAAAGMEDWNITPAVFPVGPAFDAGAGEDASGGDPKAAASGTRTPPPSVLTVDELAELLRVNRKTVYDALARGDIPGARRIGATYRILRDAVLVWLASGQDRAARSRRFR